MPRLLLGRIDPASDIAEGDDAEFWIDINCVYCFNADTGHNLLRKDDEIADTEHKTGDSDRQPETTQAGRRSPALSEVAQFNGQRAPLWWSSVTLR